MTATRRRIPVSFVITVALYVVGGAGCAHGPRPNEGGVKAAQFALERGDTAAAVMCLEEETHKRDALPAAHVQLGRILRSRGSVVDRLLSQRTLEEGLRRHPDDPNLLVELGKTYYEQTFYGDAERTFSRVLEIDPHRSEAHEYLGFNAFRMWKRVQPYTDYLATAVEHLRYAMDCGPWNKEVCLKLAFSGYVLGDTALATQTCEAFHGRCPDEAEPLFLLGVLAFDRGRWDDCWTCFRSALSLLPKEDETHYLDIGLLLSPGEESTHYEQATPEEKQDLQRIFWLEHDPDPTTEINPRLLEHVYRVFLSDMRFASANPPLRGWETQRGRAFIKFGGPTHVSTTLAGVRPWDGRTEVWTYLGPNTAFDLVFRDEYLNGNYIVPIDDEISAQTLSKDPPVTGFNPVSAPIPGVIDVIAFRDSDVSSSVYLSFSADEDSLRSRLWTWDIESFVSRAAFFQKDGRPRAFYSHTLPADSIPYQELPSGRARYVVDRYQLAFDSYRVAFSFEDEKGLTASLLWSDANTSRFLGGSLMLSDILLHTTSPSDAGPFIERSGKRYFSNPRCCYAAAEKLRVYLEIYNLSLSRGASSFDVTYSIHPADTTGTIWQSIRRSITHVFGAGASTPPVILQSFRRSGISDVASEELAVDIDSLDPGSYTITISVLDEVSGERATGSKAFVKLADTAD